MTVTREELGSRLRAAREACGMTQDDVAAHLGVSRATVAQMELGKRAVSSLELDRLAYLYGRDIREFVSDAFREQDALAALFRAQPDVLEQPGVLDKLRECIALGHELTNLERLVGIDRDQSGVATYPLPHPKNRWEAIQQGERTAELERRRLGLGWVPAPDLTELLEMQGVRTALTDLPDDISGLTLSSPDVGLFIVVNHSHHILRRRFSFAHEYAHVLLDRDRFGMISRASDRDELVEVRGNAFAAYFLMPEEGIRRFVAALGKGKPSRVYAQLFDERDILPVEGRTEPGTQEIQLYDIVQIAHHFGVSRPAMLYRLRNLRLITESELKLLKAQDDEGRGRHIADLLDLPEPDHKQARDWFRHRFLGIALEAYRRNAITRSKLNELGAMVLLSANEIDRLLSDAGLAEDGDADVLVPED